MAIGNDFGGLAADRRGIDAQSAANWFNNINAFQHQQAQDESFRGRDIQTALALAQMHDQEAARQAQMDEQAQRGADEQARYNLDYLTRQGNELYNRGQAAENMGLQRDYFDLAKAKQDALEADKLDAVKNQGAALAGSYGDASKEFQDTADTLKTIQDQMSNLHLTATKMGLLPGRDGVYRSTGKADINGVVPNMARVTRINQDAIDLANQLKQTQQVYSEKRYALNRLLNTARGTGFVPEADALVHAKTGQRFGFGAPQGQDLTSGYFAQAAGDLAQGAAPLQQTQGGASQPQANASGIIEEARNAILFQHKDPRLVKQRLIDLGIDPTPLGL